METIRGKNSFIKRIFNLFRVNFFQTHLLVLAYQKPSEIFSYNTEHDSENEINEIVKLMSRKLEMKRINEKDNDDIDFLTDIDEWKTSKSTTLKYLHEGWHCYIAKKNNEIVATGWSTQARSFQDFFLKRKFKLAQDEAYLYRGFCVPTHRGRGVIPCLLQYGIRDQIDNHGKSKFLTLVRHNNIRIISTMAKVGWKKVGRAGFIEIWGIRFHYLIGREAFKETRNRFFLQRN